MKLIHTAIPDVLIIEPKVFGDERGFFYESFNRRQFASLIGRDLDFVQDNHSRSEKMYCVGCIFKYNKHKVSWLG